LKIPTTDPLEVDNVLLHNATGSCLVAPACLPYAFSDETIVGTTARERREIRRHATAA
jgi:hypothetical protein